MGGFVSGVEAGQRLAAANCGFVGARGLFREKGADYARWVLNG
jgi:fructokinase